MFVTCFPPFHTTEWQFNYEDPTKQCAHRRQGYLCGSCPHGEVLSSAIYTGECTNISTCLSWRASVAIAVAVVVPIVPLVLYLDLPLSNDIKGLVFFYTVVRMLFYQSDLFMYKSDVSEPIIHVNSLFKMESHACTFGTISRKTFSVLRGLIVARSCKTHLGHVAWA